MFIIINFANFMENWFNIINFINSLVMDFSIMIMPFKFDQHFIMVIMEMAIFNLIQTYNKNQLHFLSVDSP